MPRKMAAEEGIEPSISRVRAERLASFGHSAKSLVAGEGVAPSVFEAYETFEPLLLHAR